MTRRSTELLRGFALFSVVSALTLGCGGESAVTGGGAGGPGSGAAGTGATGAGAMSGGEGTGGRTTTTSGQCECDPDRPETCGQECTFWTCYNVPTDFGHKIHCDARQNDGGAHAPGQYECPPEMSTVPYCPGADAPGEGTWNCLANAQQLSCERDGGSTGTGGTSGGAGDGGGNGGWVCTDTEDGRTCTQDNPDFPGDGDWDCRDVVQPDGTVRTTCTGPDTGDGGGNAPNGYVCTDLGEFQVCSGTPDYPSDGGGWVCYFTPGDDRVCTSMNPPGGGGMGGTGGGGTAGSGGNGLICTPGQQRWCDGETYCSWGKQTCNPDGTWGNCVEGDPTTGRTEGPATQCSCYYPFAYNPECCETPDCLVQGTQPLPCNTQNGQLCEPCGSDDQCGSGICARAMRYVTEIPGGRLGGGTMFPTIEQFCSRTCDDASQCGAGYNCVRPNGSPVRICVPTDGSCFR